MNLLPYQDEFIFSPAPYPAAVTAWGTGKTFAGIVKAVNLSQEYPNNLGIIFRKEFTDLQDSTARDFQDYTGITVDSHRNVILDNGSCIMFRHLEEMNNIQNVNLGWFWIEQAEEMETDNEYFKLFGRLRRQRVPHCGFVTANTNGHNWVWRLWKAGSLVKTVQDLINEHPEMFPSVTDAKQLVKLYEAKTHDNAENLPPAYLAGLEIMKKEKPKLYNRFVLNSWDEADTSDILIPSEWVDLATRRLYAPSGEVVMGVDVARFGDDNTSIVAICGRITLPPVRLSGNDTMQVAGKVAVMADELKAVRINIDSIGIGAGVYDRLKELGYPVYEVNVAQASTIIDTRTKKPKFKNLRSEVWWKARESLNPNPEMQPVPFILPDDYQLREQLTAPKYTINSAGQIEIESKDDMKERLGRSPDDADAYCLAVHGVTGDVRPWGFFGTGSGLVRTQQQANWM